MRKTSAAFLAACGAAALLLAGCGQSPNAPAAGNGAEDEPTELVFAAVPSEDSESLEAAFAPVVAALDHELDIPVRFEPVSSNAGVIEAQVAERVDIAVYGAFSYYLATGVADVVPVAVDERAPGADPSISAYGLVRAGDGISAISEAAGQKVCFTDPASSTGYLAPAAGLIEEGVDAENDITPVFAGGHDASVLALLSGDCDLAYAAQAFVDDILPAQGALEPDDVEVIWTSDPIPGPPFVLGGWLSDDLQERITEALLKYNAVTAAEAGFCEGAEIDAPDSWGELAGEPACMWGGTGAFSFIPTDAAAYEPIAKICETTQADVCRADS
jgi:phosphonate transport system substrate-binding protein